MEKHNSISDEDDNVSNNRKINFPFLTHKKEYTGNRLTGKRTQKEHKGEQ